MLHLTIDLFFNASLKDSDKLKPDISCPYQFNKLRYAVKQILLLLL